MSTSGCTNYIISRKVASSTSGGRGQLQLVTSKWLVVNVYEGHQVFGQSLLDLVVRPYCSGQPLGQWQTKGVCTLLQKSRVHTFHNMLLSKKKLLIKNLSSLVHILIAPICPKWSDKPNNRTPKKVSSKTKFSRSSMAKPVEQETVLCLR